MQVLESARELEVIGEYDLIVCGGGPAGVSAAIAAGRLGVDTLLLEATSSLGGIWTSGLVPFVWDSDSKTGLVGELKERLTDLQGYPPRKRGSGYLFDPEAMKVLLDELCLEAKVDVLFNTRVVGVVQERDKLTGVITEGPSGREVFVGHLFADCTGNGDLAAFAGCRYDVGHPETGQLQPASLTALVTGVPEHMSETRTSADKDAFCQLLRSVGVEPSYQKATLARTPYPGLWTLGVNHEYGVRHDSAKNITVATMRARREVFNAVKRLRTLPGWEKFHLVATSSQLGLREGRRVCGLYTVSVDDLINGRRWDDGICLVRFCVDLHVLEFRKGEGAVSEGIRVKPYHIPYRSLVSCDIGNLAMAGRCISGDFYAHASYRVTGNAVPMGEAVGIAAHMALEADSDFAHVDGRRVAERMRDRGHIL